MIMRPCSRLIATWLCLSLSLPALASDVVFPAGGAVGLSPPGAMTAHIGLTMFEDNDEDAVISIFEEAWGDAPGKPFSDFGNLGEVPPGIRVEGPVQHLQLAGGIEAYLVAYSDIKDGVARRHWTMVARNADLFASIFARAPAGSTLYSDAKIQAALRSIQFRKPRPKE
ncbi:hypothetical protein [Parasphingorhabdus cellanae]|uniref:Uncharacterized protein n=1 Tax=Parasphingorhabdus cellanae TaxID=2806553 RepID=A0ABX7T2L1_9SPHN|nr:hypothetical protein [Parasphingorhabdus cellanae]QTD55055.1 hypothetical protein J4G78_12565 [Parasphingorhabdus cellanae]